MGINVQATRKFNLADFAEGWDKCFLTVRTMPQRDSDVIAKEVAAARAAEDEDALMATMRDICVKLIVGGKIMNTGEDGKASLYELAPEDIPDLVDALNFSWQTAVVELSTGADRLK